MTGLRTYDPKTLLCPADDAPGTMPVKMEDGSVEQRTRSYGCNIDL